MATCLTRIRFQATWPGVMGRQSPSEGSVMESYSSLSFHDRVNRYNLNLALVRVHLRLYLYVTPLDQAIIEINAGFFMLLSPLARRSAGNYRGTKTPWNALLARILSPWRHQGKRKIWISSIADLHHSSHSKCLLFLRHTWRPL